MTEAPKIRALVSCQNQNCSEETSYHLDLVMMWKGLPICQSCYEDDESIPYEEDGSPATDWHDLPPVKLSDLRE